MSKNNNLSIANTNGKKTDFIQKMGLLLSGIGVLIILVAWAGVTYKNNTLLLTIALLSIFLGTTIYAGRTYLTKPAGVQNNDVWRKNLTSRGVYAWLLGIVLTGFYILLYWQPALLGYHRGGQNTGLVALFDPLSRFFTGKQASQWFLYGTLYTIAILSLGIKFLLKYRYNRYHFIRTLSVMVSQFFLAYLIPQILEALNPSTQIHYFSMDLKYFWPLNYYFFDKWHLHNMLISGHLGMFFLVWGIFLFAVGTPFLTYFLGKRWYCSWVCGCGGLAETAGDSFRHLSSKKLSAWKLERWLIHGILVLIILVTAVVLYGYFAHTDTFIGLDIYKYFSRPYGFLIGAMFSGVVGVGFYPLLGNRIWCRFGCPMAAYMGLFQRFKSRFRITTNGGQCISCGNCSTYCEQGIDVRWYAQRGQNIVRSSCVGCGICATVCPRGVLKLENGPEKGRIDNELVSNGK